MLYQALLAAGELEGEGTGVTVVNVPTIKPLDVEAVLNLVKEAGAVVCVEDHQIEGGLGGAIAELLAGHMPAPMEFIGLRNTFAESGKPQELIEKYGLGKEAIVAAVKKVILRK